MPVYFSRMSYLRWIPGFIMHQYSTTCLFSVVLLHTAVTNICLPFNTTRVTMVLWNESSDLFSTSIEREILWDGVKLWSARANQTRERKQKYLIVGERKPEGVSTRWNDKTCSGGRGKGDGDEEVKSIFKRGVESQWQGCLLVCFQYEWKLTSWQTETSITIKLSSHLSFFLANSLTPLPGDELD